MSIQSFSSQSHSYKSSQRVKFIHNRYTKSRGQPTLLELKCAQCKDFIALYQKDGPGRLLRLYKDRIHKLGGISTQDRLMCRTCKSVVGTFMVYRGQGKTKGEKRNAFRVKYGAIIKYEVKR